MKNKEFWIAAAHRAVRTGAQAFIATVGTAQIISEVNWAYVLSATALSMILSLATSVVTGLPEASEE